MNAQRLVALCILNIVLAGCYHLGSTLKADYRSIAVPMFANKTFKPQIEAQVSNAIIKRLQQDGALRIESTENADVIVRGQIVKYDRNELRSLERETGTPREFRIRIDVMVEALDRRSGEHVLRPTRITGTADTFIGTDLQSAELQALPLVAEDLARQVVSLLVESW
jgi:hypothetical protein